MILPHCIQVLENVLTLKGVFSTGLSEKIDTTAQHLLTWGFKLALGSDTFKSATGIYICACVLIIVQ